MLAIGSGAAQTFTQANPQLIRLRIEVDTVHSGGSFTLSYDSATDESRLETPALTVPDFTLIFVLLAVFIPILTWVLTERRRRRMATRLVSAAIAIVIALSVASQDVFTAVAAPDVFYLHDNSTPSAGISHVETQTTAQLTSTSYDLPSVAGGTDQLYLIAVAMYRDGGSSAIVSSISGTPLAWTLQKAQCSARIANPRIEVWQALGSPSSFTATVNISDAVRRTSAAISSYSGADPTTPIEGPEGSNFNGQPGACGGGITDTANAILSLTSSQNDSVLYVATHPRQRTITTPDPNYDEKAFVSNFSGGDSANLYVHDRTLTAFGTDSTDHTLSGTTDWEMAGLIINPASGLSPAGKYMNNTPGSSPATLAFNTGGQDAYWYSDISYPTGTDDSTIAAGNYFLNMYFSSLPASWWDSAYSFRQQITVTAGTAAVPSGYTVNTTFDHAALTTAKSLASGDDVRVVYWNGSGWVELDRALDEFSSWDNASTEIWFRTQAATSASGSDNNYYLYYGNSGAAAPPADKIQIFDMYDTFQDLSNWSTWQDDGDRAPQTVSATTLRRDPLL